jgi:hypothetical protein
MNFSLQAPAWDGSDSRLDHASGAARHRVPTVGTSCGGDDTERPSSSCSNSRRAKRLQRKGRTSTMNRNRMFVASALPAVVTQSRECGAGNGKRRSI